MPTQEILNSNWQAFFHDFNRSHKGWMASLDIFSTEMGAQKVVTELPLGGVFVETTAKGKQHLVLILGEGSDPHLTHTIDEPSRIWFESTAEEVVLQIEAGINTTMMMSFHRSSLPIKTAYGGLSKVSGEGI
jgi:hypothetical protein